MNNNHNEKKNDGKKLQKCYAHIYGMSILTICICYITHLFLNIVCLSPSYSVSFSPSLYFSSYRKIKRELNHFCLFFFSFLLCHQQLNDMFRFLLLFSFSITFNKGSFKFIILCSIFLLNFLQTIFFALYYVFEFFSI